MVASKKPAASEMESYLSGFLWATVIGVSIAIGARIPSVNVRSAVAYLGAGIVFLFLDVVFGYFGVFFMQREFSLRRELLLLDPRYGVSVVMLGYILFLAGIVILLRTFFRSNIRS